MVSRAADLPAHLVVDYDFNDPAMPVPHDRLAELQANTPVAYSPEHGGFWILTRYQDAYDAVHNWETFSSKCIRIPPTTDEPAIPIEIDPPAHANYRRVLNAIFNPGTMRALEPHIRRRAVGLIDAFVGRGECEFMSEFANPLSIMTFLVLMGWPLDDADDLTRWADAILHGKPGASSEEDMAHRRKAHTEVDAYFSEFIARERKNPGPGATSILLNYKYANERLLTDDELLRMLWLLLTAGLDTVRSVLGRGLILLDAQPDIREKVLADPSRIPDLVEEFVRLETPVEEGRTINRPITLGDAELLPGDAVLIPLSAANRDPERFEDPHKIRLGRQIPHLGFNAGPHRCAGSHLARIELRVAMEEILGRLPDFSVDPERPPVCFHTTVRGVHELWLKFGSTAV